MRSRMPALRGVEIPRRSKEDAGAGVGEDGAHLRRLVCGVERYGHRANPQHPEIGGNPGGVVVRKDGRAIARSHSNGRLTKVAGVIKVIGRPA